MSAITRLGLGGGSRGLYGSFVKSAVCDPDNPAWVSGVWADGSWANGSWCGITPINYVAGFEYTTESSLLEYTTVNHMLEYTTVNHMLEYKV